MAGWLDNYKEDVPKKANGGLTLPYWKDLNKQYYINSDRPEREYAMGGWTDLDRRYGFYGQYPGYAYGSHVVHGGPTWPEYAMGLDSGATLHQTLDTLRGNPKPKILDTSAQGNLPKKAKYPSNYSQGVKKYSLSEEGRSLYEEGGRITTKGKKVRSIVPRVSYTEPSGIYTGPTTQRGITFENGGPTGKNKKVYTNLNEFNQAEQARQDSSIIHELMKEENAAALKYKDVPIATGYDRDAGWKIHPFFGKYWTDEYQSKYTEPIARLTTLNNQPPALIFGEVVPTSSAFAGSYYATRGFKKPVVQPVYRPEPMELMTPKGGMSEMQPAPNPYPTRAMLSESDENIMMPSGQMISRKEFIKQYGEPAWNKATNQGNYKKEDGGWLNSYEKGGMIKRADGSYSRRGLWDNIRANRGSGKKPTKEMLKQERKIRAAEKKADGGPTGPVEPTPPPAKKYQPTSAVDYINPMNWFVPNLDDAGTFDQAFAKARKEGMDEFMWYGTRYNTELKPQMETSPQPSANAVNGISNDVLLRQAYKESSFNPKAKSPKGYMGLAQVGNQVIDDYMKATGKKNINPYDPKDAVKVQKWAMDDLYNAEFINKKNQSEQVRMAKTLAAYNWGRGNLAEFLNDKKAKGYDIYNSLDWTKELPSETSDYINKILLAKDEGFEKKYNEAVKTSSIPLLYKADGSFIGIEPMKNTNMPAPRYNKTPDKAVMPVVYANEPNTPDWSKGAKFADGGPTVTDSGDLAVRPMTYDTPNRVNIPLVAWGDGDNMRGGKTNLAGYEREGFGRKSSPFIDMNLTHGVPSSDKYDYSYYDSNSPDKTEISTKPSAYNLTINAGIKPEFVLGRKSYTPKGKEKLDPMLSISPYGYARVDTGILGAGILGTENPQKSYSNLLNDPQYVVTKPNDAILSSPTYLHVNPGIGVEVAKHVNRGGAWPQKYSGSFEYNTRKGPQVGLKAQFDSEQANAGTRFGINYSPKTGLGGGFEMYYNIGDFYEKMRRKKTPPQNAITPRFKDGGYTNKNNWLDNL